MHARAHTHTRISNLGSSVIIMASAVLLLLPLLLLLFSVLEHAHPVTALLPNSYGPSPIAVRKIKYVWICVCLCCVRKIDLGFLEFWDFGGLQFLGLSKGRMMGFDVVVLMFGLCYAVWLFGGWEVFWVLSGSVFWV